MKKVICYLGLVLLVFMTTSCYYESENKTTSNITSETVCVHSYSEATCLNPARCVMCGDTSGSLGAHSFKEGVCSYCYEEDPDWEPPVLSDSEYERINALMEGMYQFRTSAGNLVEYNFKDGTFTCYTQLGNSILENRGTYILTTKTLVLHYQNGTVKDCAWKVNQNGEVELFLLELN